MQSNYPPGVSGREPQINGPLEGDCGHVPEGVCPDCWADHVEEMEALARKLNAEAAQTRENERREAEPFPEAGGDEIPF